MDGQIKSKKSFSKSKSNHVKCNHRNHQFGPKNCRIQANWVIQTDPFSFHDSQEQSFLQNMLNIMLWKLQLLSKKIVRILVDHFFQNPNWGNFFLKLLKNGTNIIKNAETLLEKLRLGMYSLCASTNIKF